jgi:hypothetical protein
MRTILLDPAKFVRLGRGTLAAVDSIIKVHLLSGGAISCPSPTGRNWRSAVSSPASFGSGS